MVSPMPVDAIDKALDHEIDAACKALLELAETDREKWWTAFELKVQARNGWSSAVMGLALRRLVAEDLFEQRSDLRVRIGR
jgi:hypothetical protein